MNNEVPKNVAFEIDGSVLFIEVSLIQGYPYIVVPHYNNIISQCTIYYIPIPGKHNTSILWWVNTS